MTGFGFIWLRSDRVRLTWPVLPRSEDTRPALLLGRIGFIGHDLGARRQVGSAKLGVDAISDADIDHLGLGLLFSGCGVGHEVHAAFAPAERFQAGVGASSTFRSGRLVVFRRRRFEPKSRVGNT